MTWLELLLGRTPEPTLMASIVAVFLSLSLGASVGLIVYTLLQIIGDEDQDPEPKRQA